MQLGKHEDFLFEGMKSKSGAEKRLVLKSESNNKENHSHHEMHKVHHKYITR